MPKLIKFGLALTVLVLFFCAGVAIATYIENFPFLELDKEVGITDLANLLLTIIVAFWIPITLNPLITNKRTVKDFLISEVKDCIKFFESIKEKIDSAAHETTTKKAKTIINGMIGQSLAMKISSLNSQLEGSFSSQSKELRVQIDQAYLEYWRETTGGNLMTDTFKFNVEYSNQHLKAFSKLELVLKQAIFKVNKY